MTETIQGRLPQIAFTGRVLGQLLSASPDDEACRPLLTALGDVAWLDEWPYGGPDVLRGIAGLLAEGLSDAGAETPAQAYQRLFIGPDALAAPPWGSVYLDRESVLFGESTLSLRRWRQEQGIETQQQDNEPEDSIGMLLLLSAWLAEQQRGELLDSLLARHLFPWCFRYLTLLETHAGHPLYLGAAKLAALTLREWQASCDVASLPARLYF
ncbi:Tat proofreading chaperone DmsD [Acerihabitans sp. KWT182]|uniref:Tat proofreading chaperone DmsD n=1 Tax=Acerihabitans sp. KWT182 TaxID=3157919 RepID=A0AAU7QE74_9GAMM